MSRYPEIDLHRIRTISIARRKSKIQKLHLAKPVVPSSSFWDFWESLPSILAGKNLKALVEKIVLAIEKKKPILWMCGAHVIKVGLSPILIQLMKKGAVSGLAFNGAGVIHDVELAYFGQTSEEVDQNIQNGTFGMAKETAEIVNSAVEEGAKQGLGFGEAIGKRILEDEAPYNDQSLFAQAYLLEIPATVHVALGTDIVHQHPSSDGKAIGELSLRDFRIFSHLVSQLHHGGVVLLFGSAVILPEVFLKALSVARNIHHKVTGFTTATFDMYSHYRPRRNVVERPTWKNGKGFSFIGHHEILLPLLALAIEESLHRKRKK